MGIEELAKLAEESTFHEMERAHVIEREHSEAPWHVTEAGWVWMMMLARLAGIGMKDAKFVDILEHARRAHASHQALKDEHAVCMAHDAAAHHLQRV